MSLDCLYLSCRDRTGRQSKKREYLRIEEFLGFCDEVFITEDSRVCTKTFQRQRPSVEVFQLPRVFEEIVSVDENFFCRLLRILAIAPSPSLHDARHLE